MFATFHHIHPTPAGLVIGQQTVNDHTVAIICYHINFTK